MTGVQTCALPILPSSPLALLVKDSELPKQSPSQGRMEILSDYVKAMDDPSRPKLTWKWLDNNHLQIQGDIPEDYRLALAVNHDAGWAAVQGTRAIPVFTNQLGFITLHPTPQQNATIDLYYSAGAEPKLFAIISLAVWIGCLLRLRKDRQNNIQ